MSDSFMAFLIIIALIMAIMVSVIAGDTGV
jgi:hypothetical protein